MKRNSQEPCSTAADNPLAPFNELEKSLSHLYAMLLCSFGGGGESFREMNHEDQDNFLWACHDKVIDAQLQVEMLGKFITKVAA